ncbi:GlxA family transcriptional regulator [Mycolicibacterium sp. jd]|uniref:Helix-turn-helix domain-containing protein n=1 Tax=Mycolicibacterium austroafricanum TaxID=39687 RepID=A0ABT8HM42_MYCAO|nr:MULTISPECIES: helix-turn-helix domain-containing protein [Mycolicibacterium]MDN4521838.1 helix-turn-helix domain-containing protein [Mycolicibacterium austroafricanum]UJL30587.1 helix-turn-helix domain-containing protein [Mycolicibacterium vanbaalenii]WND56307.1 helix-turn-helix domain-containing protein [Mycolicibacterium vanbaalenii]
MRVALLLTESVFDSGLSIVCDVLETANSLRSELCRPPAPWEITLVGFRRLHRTARGHQVRAESPASIDPEVLVVPAVGVKDPAQLVGLVEAPTQRRAIGLVSTLAAGGVVVAGACTGTFFLAEAGVLNGRQATTSWWLGPAFRTRYPMVDLDTRATLVHDAAVATAGAAFAHIDLALWLVRRHSPALAELVARYLLIGDRASQAAFALPSVLAVQCPEVAAFERWVRDHLGESVSICEAAAAIGVSERTLQRRTMATLGLSPLGFANEIRLEEAAHLLRSTSLSADAVAAAVGFRNASSLGQLVRRRRGSTVRALRGATSRVGEIISDP